MDDFIRSIEDRNFTIENGFEENDYTSRRSSLVSFAKFESLKNKATQELLIIELKKEEPKNLDLTEEEILLFNQFPKEDPNMRVVTTLVFSLKNGLNSMQNILKCIEKQNGRIQHLETRPSKNNKFTFDVLVRVGLKKNELLNLLQSVRHIDNINLYGIPKKDIWFPRHISDLGKCNHVLSKFEPDLDSSHPGFSDVSYRARRKEIAEIAFQYKYGQAIPTVNYTKEEIQTWATVFNTLYQLQSKYACASYRKAFRLLEEECNYGPDIIPQLQEVSMFLKKRTGFTLRPATGLVTARDFLASLAFRVFQCTQYVRHGGNPHHSPEPDCIHELLGHVPMLADLEFAKFSQEIGLSSLGASDEDIEKLSTIYWFTVEFGLCKEENSVKAYGAGLLSSYGELLHAISEKPKLLPFEPKITAVQPYQDLTYQDVYFVADSFNDAKDKIRDFVDLHINRQNKVVYDPYTESVLELDSTQLLERAVESITSELSSLLKALNRLKHQ